MKSVSVFLRRLRSLFRRSALDRAMDEEMRFHLEEQTRENLAAGMSPHDARRAAAIAFGGAERIKEEARERRAFAWVDDVVGDARYAVRMLRKSPGFTTASVLTLALGLGLSTAFFTWFNAAVFRPLPVHEPEQLLKLGAVSYPDYLDYRAVDTGFSGLLAWTRYTNATLIGDSSDASDAARGDPESLNLQMVSTNYFAVLGGTAVVGRTLAPDDASAAAAAPVIVLSHRFWQRRFGGDRNVIGKTIRIRGLQHELLTVVGVAAPEFVGATPSVPDGWASALLLDQGRWSNRGDGRYTLIGRLRPGVSREHTQSALQATADRLAREHPERRGHRRVILESAATYVDFSARTLMFVSPLIAAFGVVLLIACANVSNLVLARTVTRQGELGVRRALGATARRLFMQLLIESLVLGALGGVAGWLVADLALGLAYPLFLSSPEIARALSGLNLAPDHRVFLFALAAATFAGLAGGLLPAWQASRRDVVSALRQESSGFGRRIRPSHVRSMLAIAQLALGSALLFNAGLLVHRALQLQWRDLGFDRTNLVTLELLTPEGGDAGQQQSRQRLLERLRAMPGVAAAAELRRLPFGSPRIMEIHTPARGAAGPATFRVPFADVAADYFETLKIPLVRGRSFTVEESTHGQTAIVSQAAAQKLWPGEDPIGKRFETPSMLLQPAPSTLERGASPPSRSAWVTVIGVAGDTRMNDLRNGDGPLIYLPAAPGSAPYLVVRTRQPLESLLPALRRAAVEITGIAPYIRPVDKLFAAKNAEGAMFAWMAGGLGALALVLAVVGLYGLLAFSVNQRVREIGVRLALGASPGRVAAGVLGKSLRLVAIGGVAGFALGAAVARLLRSTLPEIAQFDAVACAAVSAMLAVLGLLACWLPARRAAKTDPLIALRAE